MEYVVKLSSDADKDYDKHILTGDHSLIEKIESLKALMVKDPYGRFERTGKGCCRSEEQRLRLICYHI